MDEEVKVKTAAAVLHSGEVIRFVVPATAKIVFNQATYVGHTSTFSIDGPDYKALAIFEASRTAGIFFEDGDEETA